MGGEYPVPKLLSWLTTYIHVTSIPRFPEGLPDLPRQRTAMRIDEPAIRSPATWQWMADLLQYWSNVSNTKTPGGLFRTQSTLVERLMDTVNLWFSEKHRVTWGRVAFGTFHWLQARTMFTLDQKADYERQLRREGTELNDLEAATQRLWQEWMEADEMKKKQQQAKAAAQRQLPPEHRAAQLEREKQAKVTGLSTSPSVENRYPGWVARPRKKPADGHDPPAPYQAPRDVRERDRNQTIDERNTALADELGANDVLDPLKLPYPPQDLRSPPALRLPHSSRMLILTSLPSACPAPRPLPMQTTNSWVRVQSLPWRPPRPPPQPPHPQSAPRHFRGHLDQLSAL